MTELTHNKERIHWIDMAKGILIILVAMHHMTMRGDELGISCPAISFFMPLVSTFLFYMPAFFVIAGFFARYDASFKDFIIKNARALLLPLIIFSLLGGILKEIFYEILKGSYNADALESTSFFVSIDYWFILALFLAKCIYWGVSRISEKFWVRLSVCLGFYVLGVAALKIWLPNYFCWNHALILLVYLPIGQWIFNHLDGWKAFLVSLVVLIAGCCFYRWQGLNVPAPEGSMLLNLKSALPSLLLCVAGSFVFLKLCSLVKRARLLEIIGRNTLAIYIMHWWVEVLALKVLRGFFSQGVWVSTMATLVVLAAAVLVPCLISELLNHPKLRWVLGKS